MSLKCMCCSQVDPYEFSNKQFKKANKPGHVLRCNKCIAEGRTSSSAQVSIDTKMSTGDLFMHKEKKHKREYEMEKKQEAEAIELKGEEQEHFKARIAALKNVERQLSFVEWDWQEFIKTRRQQQHRQKEQAQIQSFSEQYEIKIVHARNNIDSINLYQKKLQAARGLQNSWQPSFFNRNGEDELFYQHLQITISFLEETLQHERISSEAQLLQLQEELAKKEKQQKDLEDDLVKFVRFEGFQLMINLLHNFLTQQSQRHHSSSSSSLARKHFGTVQQYTNKITSYQKLNYDMGILDKQKEILVLSLIKVIHFVVQSLSNNQFDIWQFICLLEAENLLPFTRFLLPGSFVYVTVATTRHDILLDTDLAQLPDDLLRLIVDMDVFSPGGYRPPHNNAMLPTLKQIEEMPFILPQHWHGLQDVLEGLKYLVPKFNVKLHQKLYDYTAYTQIICLNGKTNHKTKASPPLPKHESSYLVNKICTADIHLHEISGYNTHNLKRTQFPFNDLYYTIPFSCDHAVASFVCQYLRKWSSKYVDADYLWNAFHPSTRRWKIIHQDQFNAQCYKHITLDEIYNPKVMKLLQDILLNNEQCSLISDVISIIQGYAKETSRKYIEEQLTDELATLNDINDSGMDGDDHSSFSIGDSHAFFEFRIVSLSNLKYLPFVGKRLRIHIIREDIFGDLCNTKVDLSVDGIPISHYGVSS